MSLHTTLAWDFQPLENIFDTGKKLRALEKTATISNIFERSLIVCQKVAHITKVVSSELVFNYIGLL